MQDDWHIAHLVKSNCGFSLVSGIEFNPITVLTIGKAIVTPVALEMGIAHFTLLRALNFAPAAYLAGRKSRLLHCQPNHPWKWKFP